MTGFKKTWFKILLSSIFLFTAQPTMSQALQISQEKFQDEYREGKIKLPIMGAALKRFSVIKEIAVAFYLEKGIPEENILTDVPKRIELAVIQKVSKDELIKETLKGMEDNLDESKFNSLNDQIQELNSWYKDSEPGDRYIFTYLPGLGTRVEYNGVKQGIIAGEDFAYGFFSIYVGAKPADIRAKQKLLGRLKLYQ